MPRFLAYLGGPVIGALVAFTMLPWLCRFLGPEHWGRLALATAFAGLGAAFCIPGSSLVLARHMLAISPMERHRLIATLLHVGVLSALIMAALLSTAWVLLPEEWRSASGLGWREVSLALATMVLTVPWSLAIDSTMLDGRAWWYTVGLTGQAIAWAVVSGLCVLSEQGAEISLFAGQTAGAAVLCLAGLLSLRGSLMSLPTLVWLREVMRLAPTALAGSFGESAAAALERSLLTSFVGAFQLGIYAHAQQWRGPIQMLAKAGSRSVWPMTLTEARTPASEFSATHRTWLPIHLVIANASVGMLLIGGEVIGWLTHGRFVGAQWPAGALLAVLLIQNSGRPQIGWLYACERGNAISRLIVISTGASVIALVVLVPAFGLVGALAAALVQGIVLRLGVHHACRGTGLPHQDGAVLMGLAAIGLSALSAFLLQSNPLLRWMLAALSPLLFLALWTTMRQREDAHQP